jgi:hypothetical protein
MSKTTMRQHLLFEDADLCAPQHDEIMLWLDGWLTPENAAGFLGLAPERSWNVEGTLRDLVADYEKEHFDDAADVLELIKGWSESEVAQARALDEKLEGQSWPSREALFASQPLIAKLQPIGLDGALGYHRFREHVWGLRNAVPARPATRVTAKHWEQLVGDDRGRTMGFVDLAAEVRWPRLDWSCPCKGIVGVPDWDAAELEVHDYTVALLFEVKTRVHGLGELIRQLNYYLKYYHGWSTYQAIVVSPDDRFQTVLVEQGFGFLKYPEGTATPGRWLKEEA